MAGSRIVGLDKVIRSGLTKIWFGIWQVVGYFKVSQGVTSEGQGGKVFTPILGGR